jgi:PAS fold
MTTAAAEPVSGLAAATLDLLPQSLYIVDRHLTVVAWNARREQGPLGLARVRALGHSLREVLSPLGFDSVLPAFRHVLDTGTPYEEERTTRDGRRTYRIRRLPIADGGTVTHVVTLSYEVAGASLQADSAESTARRRGLLPLERPRDLTLNGVIPVCAWCKKIRDLLGDWHQVEAYLATRSDATFTHGICEDCAGRVRLAAQAVASAPAVSAPPDRPTAPSASGRGRTPRDTSSTGPGSSCRSPGGSPPRRRRGPRPRSS